jgi:predicted dehydrogenase
MRDPMRVGIIGCGDVSAQYLQTLEDEPAVEVVAVADRNIDRARARAEQFGIGWYGVPDALIASPDVELVLNLTTPVSHEVVSSAVLRAGKHVWSEKPLALTASAARDLIELAATSGVSIACAPDTPLAPGIRSAMVALKQGAIGQAASISTVAASQGPDAWHPRPEFLFATGAGPVLDIGPYYVSVMLMMFGDVDSVTATGKRRQDIRTISVGERAGETFPVEVWTEVQAEVCFTSGLRATSLFSFDADVNEQRFEVQGSAGALSVPIDAFTGAACLRGLGDRDAWRSLTGFTGEPSTAVLGRGSGVIEQVRALQAGREPLLNGALAARVLEVLEAIVHSADCGESVAIAASHVG